MCKFVFGDNEGCAFDLSYSCFSLILCKKVTLIIEVNGLHWTSAILTEFVCLAENRNQLHTNCNNNNNNNNDFISIALFHVKHAQLR